MSLDPRRPVVRVLRNPRGWWEVFAEDVSVAQYMSEFQAREAGRLQAARLECDLLITQPSGPEIYEVFDDSTGQMRTLTMLTPAPADTPGGRKQLILVVEDLVDARELYADYLTYAGFSVATAINGHEAVRLARMLKPDLVLMDIRLPGMDGLEATADLKRTPELAHIPVVAITADPSEEIAARCRQAGCAAFISKPVLPDEVVRQIRVVLNGAGLERR